MTYFHREIQKEGRSLFYVTHFANSSVFQSLSGFLCAQVVAIVTDRLTDCTIIGDLHNAASRGVPVYIILNQRSIQENFTLNRLRHPVSHLPHFSPRLAAVHLCVFDRAMNQTQAF